MRCATGLKADCAGGGAVCLVKCRASPVIVQHISEFETQQHTHFELVIVPACKWMQVQRAPAWFLFKEDSPLTHFDCGEELFSELILKRACTAHFLHCKHQSNHFRCGMSLWIGRRLGTPIISVSLGILGETTHLLKGFNDILMNNPESV